MTDAASPSTGVSPRTQRLKARLRARYARETRFRWYGRAAIGVALAFLVILLGSIITQGYTAFYAHTVTLPVYMDPARIDRSYPQGANFEQIVAEQQIRRLGVQDDEQGTKASAMKALLSSELKFQAAKMIARQPSLLGQTVPVAAPLSDDAEMYLKGKITRDQPEDQRRVSNAQMDWLDRMKASGAVRAHFNSALFTKGDSTQPELAGLLGAVVGSALMLMVTALIAIPVGVGAAVWLEEYSPRNRITAIIEVNINNLAAVPSIVFGLLGAAVFINFFNLPRSAPLVGGLVLTLMTLPTIIIATRAALQGVSPALRQAALGLGASKTQMVFHHVLPVTFPSILTATIIGVAQALGETAPLLLIGMNAFVAAVPGSPVDQATALPVQIFLWQGNENRNFFEARTSAAIMVLLGLMILLNAIAIILRSRLEKRA